MARPLWGVIVAAAVAMVGCDGGGAGPCEDVDCAGHGRCVSSGSSPSCRCDPGYRALGLLCLPEAGDGDADSDLDVDADDERDADQGDGGGGEPGPITMVVTGAEFSLLRLCDFDGDGEGDNAVADLGSPSADMFALALSAVVSRNLDSGFYISVAHMPWVDDMDRPDDPETLLIVFEGKDTDEPKDASDDRSGEEPFYVKGSSVNGCGEPLYAHPETTVDDGELRASGGSLSLQLTTTSPPVQLQQGQVTGTIAPAGESADLYFCGCVRAQDLGNVPGEEGWAAYNGLELLLAGGAIFGLPTVPGLVPDVDLDGDGLETFELDADSFLSRCIDGDGTVIAGRDCWQDPRIADAVSLTVRHPLVAASLAGLEPGWEGGHPEGCDGGPPEESLWDPR